MHVFTLQVPRKATLGVQKASQADLQATLKAEKAKAENELIAHLQQELADKDKPKLFASLDTKAKSAFTRAYNSVGHSAQGLQPASMVVKKKRKKSSTDAMQVDDDDYVSEDDEEEVDVSQLFAKKKRKAPSKKPAARKKKK